MHEKRWKMRFGEVERYAGFMPSLSPEVSHEVVMAPPESSRVYHPEVDSVMPAIMKWVPSQFGGQGPADRRLCKKNEDMNPQNLV